MLKKNNFLKAKNILKRGFDRNKEEIPLIIKDTCDYIEKNGLKEEGIFRVSGARTEIIALKKQYLEGFLKKILY